MPPDHNPSTKALIALSQCSGKRLFTRFQNPLYEGTPVTCGLKDQILGK